MAGLGLSDEVVRVLNDSCTETNGEGRGEEGGRCSSAGEGEVALSQNAKGWRAAPEPKRAAE